MDIELTERGREAATKLQLPIATRDAINMVMASKKVNSKEAQKIKIEALILIKENKFYEAIIKITEMIGLIEDDQKELTMTEREMEIKIV